MATAAQQGWADFHATNGRLTALGAPTVAADDSRRRPGTALLSWADTLSTDLATDAPGGGAGGADHRPGDGAGVGRTSACRHRRRPRRAGGAHGGRPGRRQGPLGAGCADCPDRRAARAAGRPARRRGDPCLAGGAPPAGRAGSRWLGHGPSRRQWPGSRPRPYETVGGPSSRRARARLLQARDGFAALGVPALDTDDLPRAWSELATWAGERAGQRRADLVDLAVRLERLDGDLGERSTRVRGLLEAHAIDRTGEAVPTDPASPTDGGPHGPDPHRRWSSAASGPAPRPPSIVAAAGRRRTAADHDQPRHRDRAGGPTAAAADVGQAVPAVAGRRRPGHPGGRRLDLPAAAVRRPVRADPRPGRVLRHRPRRRRLRAVR